jgi:transposase
MERLLQRCAALDVHQASVSACVRVPGERDERLELSQRFGATTPDLLALADWLRGHGVTHVAMEGTGVYWKPVYYALEGEFELLLVNAAHVKQVPGRKTDTKDAAWLCQLLECGLLRASFVPPKPIRELRDLTRYRKTLIRDRASEANRLHKVLEDAGVKLSSVASNVLGVSGRLMLEALCQGTNDPEVLAELARGRLRSKLPAGAGEPLPRPSRVPGHADPRPSRLPRRGDRCLLGEDRGGDRPFRVGGQTARVDPRGRPT